MTDTAGADLGVAAERFDVPAAALSPEVLERVMLAAIRDERFDVIEGLMGVYVAVHPERAVAFYEELQLALKVADLVGAGVVTRPAEPAPGTGWPE
ncbi:hypothetical protein [Kineosporia sp. R_H_3]|uniref:hypothetical protein n=1 Tax=Kineosporia sp. R_H_3 TaxID=1961848 RepID=UPI000B4B2224|nr:hypothetical protein [Kineosporia sp. R_H_3]